MFPELLLVAAVAFLLYVTRGKRLDGQPAVHHPEEFAPWFGSFFSVIWNFDRHHDWSEEVRRWRALSFSDSTKAYFCRLFSFMLAGNLTSCVVALPRKRNSAAGACFAHPSTLNWQHREWWTTCCERISIISKKYYLRALTMTNY
jgi:hypothetical protein